MRLGVELITSYPLATTSCSLAQLSPSLSQPFWQKHPCCFRSLFRHSTDNDVIEPLFSLWFSLFHFSVTTFSNRSSARIKKLILQKLMGAPKTLGEKTHSKLRRPFWGPWRPFWIFEGLIKGIHSFFFNKNKVYKNGKSKIVMNT